MIKDFTSEGNVSSMLHIFRTTEGNKLENSSKSITDVIIDKSPIIFKTSCLKLMQIEISLAYSLVSLKTLIVLGSLTIIPDLPVYILRLIPFQYVYQKDPLRKGMTKYRFYNIRIFFQ